MQPLNLPSFTYKLRKVAKKYYIFDITRKKYVYLTPEEWVRQHFVNYLMGHLAYPKTLMSLERWAAQQRKLQRMDIVIYNRIGIPFMLVECKAPTASVDHHVFDQAARYNVQVKAQYLVVTNGLEHICCHMNHQKLPGYAFLDNIPNFPKQ